LGRARAVPQRPRNAATSMPPGTTAIVTDAWVRESDLKRLSTQSVRASLVKDPEFPEPQTTQGFWRSEISIVIARTANIERGSEASTPSHLLGLRIDPFPSAANRTGFPRRAPARTRKYFMLEAKAYDIVTTPGDGLSHLSARAW
jgi:hypothetical protein